jgi:hypothetical protein
MTIGFFFAVIVGLNLRFSRILLQGFFQFATAFNNFITLQRTKPENLKQIFPEKKLLGHSPNVHIHVSVSNLYIPTIDLHILLQEISGPILGIYKLLRDT